MSQSKPALLTVGSVAFDSVETPGGSVDRALGGSATYASLAASYFCAPRVVAVVGDDFGDEHIESLRKRGIDTTGIERVSGKTFHWRGRYHENMQDRDTLETQLNVFESFDPEVPDVFLQDVDHLLHVCSRQTPIEPDSHRHRSSIGRQHFRSNTSDMGQAS